jgi:3-phytase
MSHRPLVLTRPARLAGAAVAVLALTAVSMTTGGVPAGAVSDRARQPDVAFSGESTVAAGLTYQGTVVGGLSSLTYDESREVYYALSDAQRNLGQGPFRFYTLRVDTSDGRLDPGDVTVVGVTLLTDASGLPLVAGEVDPEGLTLTAQDTLIITSEGFAIPATDTAPERVVKPFVKEFNLDGRQLRELALPPYVAPVLGASGVRNNLGLESAAVTPDGRQLITGFENALAQDGPASSLTTTSASRLLDIELADGAVRHEYVYRDDPIVDPPTGPMPFAVSGLVELLPFNRRFGLAMERSFSTGAGNTIRLYRYSLAGADDVYGVDRLESVAPVREASKHLVLDLDELGLTLDNVEGMTLGPRLPDGGRALILMSDNNFALGQVSQFLLFSAHGVGSAA